MEWTRRPDRRFSGIAAGEAMQATPTVSGGAVNEPSVRLVQSFRFDSFPDVRRPVMDP